MRIRSIAPRSRIAHAFVAAVVLVLLASVAPHDRASTLFDAEFWKWRREGGRNASSNALESAFSKVRANPGQARFYPEISGICAALDVNGWCYDRLASLRERADAVTKPYVDHALSRTSADHDQAASAQHAYSAATSVHLTTALSRFLVDDAASSRIGVPLDTLASWWTRVRSKGTGHRFGQAYIHIKMQDWDLAEAPLLELAANNADDPEIFRELGRLYFFTGDREKCIEAATRSVGAARRSGKLDAELTALGNLVYARLRWDGATEEVRNELFRLVDVAEQAGNLTAKAVNSYRLGEIEARLGRYSNALRHLKSAEVHEGLLPPDLRVSLHATRAEVHRRMYRFDAALDELRTAESQARRYDVEIGSLSARHYRSQLYRDLGRLDEAETIVRGALEQAQARNLTSLIVSARTTLGDLLIDRSEYAAAIDAYLGALDIAARDDSKWQVRDLYLKLATAHACLRNYVESERLAELALENALAAGDSVDVSYAHSGIGKVYLLLGNLELADQHLHAAISYLKGREMDRALVVIYHLLVGLSIERKDAVSAYHYLSNAEERTSDWRTSLENARLRGYVELMQADYNAALLAFEEAESYRREEYDGSAGWSIDHGQALALWRLRRPHDAEAAFRRALADVESRRSTYRTALHRSLLAQSSVELFESYAAFLGEQGRLSEAVEIGERGRSRALVDLLYTTQAGRGNSSGSATERAIDARTRSRAIDLERSESASTNRSGRAARERVSYLQEERKSADKLFRSLERDLKGENPLYTFSPIPPDSIQAILPEDEAAVVYTLRAGSPTTAAASEVYVVRRDRIALVPLEIKDVELEEAVRFFRDAITTSEKAPGTGWEAGARHLYDVLIRPVIPFVGRNTRHLHIIPEGPLHYLPFAALQDSTGEFVVERYDISYAPSLTVLKLSRDRNPGTWRSMLLLADPDGDLPGARHEAALIAAQDPERRTMVVGSDARQDLLEREAAKHDVIHVATHGTFHARTPLASSLKLSGDVLTVDEIGQLSLNAYLVTLSACETALSGGLLQDHAPGEEWVGLHQAFMAAGTPTILASLWKIHDRYSGPLMSRFYERLGPLGKAHALAEVQRGYIADPRTRHPYFWAPFTVIGDPL